MGCAVHTVTEARQRSAVCLSVCVSAVQPSCTNSAGLCTQCSCALSHALCYLRRCCCPCAALLSQRVKLGEALWLRGARSARNSLKLREYVHQEEAHTLHDIRHCAVQWHACRQRENERSAKQDFSVHHNF
jgi:hypothetical protein